MESWNDVQRMAVFGFLLVLLFAPLVVLYGLSELFDKLHWWWPALIAGLLYFMYALALLWAIAKTLWEVGCDAWRTRNRRSSERQGDGGDVPVPGSEEGVRADRH